MIFPEASIYAYTPVRSTEMAELTVHSNLLPAEPLRKRVPERDTDGGPLADVMVLLPGLRDLPQHLLRTAIAQIQPRISYLTRKTQIRRTLDRAGNGGAAGNFSLSVGAMWGVRRRERRRATDRLIRLGESLALATRRRPGR